MITFRLAAIAVLATIPLGSAVAQDADAAKSFPSRPIRIVVPSPTLAMTLSGPALKTSMPSSPAGTVFNRQHLPRASDR